MKQFLISLAATIGIGLAYFFGLNFFGHLFFARANADAGLLFVILPAVILVIACLYFAFRKDGFTVLGLIIGYVLYIVILQLLLAGA